MFTLSGFSVVNGAQTVGSIFASQAAGVISPDAKLLITLIQVGAAPGTLGLDITRARNTQNAVRGLHFAALDHNQERLRCELAVSGIEYHYRPSEEATQGGPNVITFEQAAIALASFSGDTKTIVAAKKEISQIHDRNGAFYPTLFREGLTGVALCRAVRVFDYLNGILAASERAEPKSRYFRRMFYRHGRYFILHIFARLHRALLTTPEIKVSQEHQAELSRHITDLAELIYTVAEARFQRNKGYLAVFRNVTDSVPLAQDVMQRLAQRNAQAQAAAAPAPVVPANADPGVARNNLNSQTPQPPATT